MSDKEKTSFTERFASKKAPQKNSPNDLLTKKKPSEETEEEGSTESGEFAGDKNNFMDHVIKSRTDMCFHVMGKDTTGRTAWYFMLIDKDKKEAFLKHKPGDSYDLADYGKVIASGYGEEVPDDVKEMLKEKYGFDNF